MSKLTISPAPTLVIVGQEMREAVRDLGEGPVHGYEWRLEFARSAGDLQAAPRQWTQWYFVSRAAANDLLVTWSQYLSGLGNASASKTPAETPPAPPKIH
jgi:hypothetical protein